MQPSTTSYHHGYNSYRRGSNSGVKSYFLLPIPGWEVKTCHCTHHTVHYFATDHPRGRIRQGPYSTISGIRPYPPVLDLATTRPRPTIGQQGEKADVAHDSGSFHRLVLYVTMVSRDGRPFPGHVATTTSTGIDKTSQRHPRRPCLLLPYKRAGRGSTTSNEQRTTDNEKPVSIPPKKINISSTLLHTLIFSLRPGLGSLSHSL
jgi:hypothetical protein